MTQTKNYFKMQLASYDVLDDGIFKRVKLKCIKAYEQCSTLEYEHFTPNRVFKHLTSTACV